MFDVRVFFGSALDVRRWMFDVRIFLFGSALDVQRSMFDVRAFFGSLTRDGLILPADLINPLIDEIESIKRILTSIVKSTG